MLGLLTLAAVVFFALGWRWRGARSRQTEALLEQRIDDETRSAILARQEQDAALTSTTADSTLEALSAELRESQARQLSLERELLRLRDAKLELEIELKRLRPEASLPIDAPPASTSPSSLDSPAAGRLPLTVLRGLGPAFEKKLLSAGVTSVQELAALSADEVASLDRSLKLNGRALRDGWLEQARALVESSSPLSP